MANEYVAPSTDGHYLADQQNQQKWAQLVTRAWADESLKQRLLNDPAPLLQEYGIETPAGLELRVVQDKDVIACMVQPQMLAGELTPSQLSGVVGGGKPTGGKPGQYTRKNEAKAAVFREPTTRSVRSGTLLHKSACDAPAAPEFEEVTQN